jgi:Ca-activated chloride channel family protein
MRFAVAISGLLLAAGASALALQEPPYRVRVDVPLVSIEAFVDDVTGKPVTNLKREDFIILEDGQPREITNFSSAETPYHLLLLFDRSASTQNQWPFLLQAVGRLVRQLGEQDRVALAAFDAKPEMVLDWRAPGAMARQTLNMRTNGSGTDVYKALEWAAEETREIKGRKGIVVFTDGIDNRLDSELVRAAGNDVVFRQPAEDGDFEKVLKAVMRAGLPYYFVAINTDVNAGPGVLTTGFEFQRSRQARLRMELVAGRSHGSIYFPTSLPEVGELYERIGRELGNSYSLGFVPASLNDGRFRRVEVRVRTTGMRVTQTRDGYYAGQP